MCRLSLYPFLESERRERSVADDWANVHPRKEGDIYPWNTTCCPVSVSLRLSLRIDTANRGTRFHISRGRCFHGGPRSISRSPIVDRERRFDAQNLLQGSQATSQQKREKRLASLAYRVSTSLFFLFLFFRLFISICSSFVEEPCSSTVIAATLIVSRIPMWLQFLFKFSFSFFFFLPNRFYRIYRIFCKSCPLYSSRKKEKNVRNEKVRLKRKNENARELFHLNYSSRFPSLYKASVKDTPNSKN